MDLGKGVPINEKSHLLISMIDLIARQSAAHSIISLEQTRPKVGVSADNAAVARVNVMQSHRPGAPNPDIFTRLDSVGVLVNFFVSNEQILH